MASEENKRNRAKCTQCLSVIESFFWNDYVSCKCGEIYVAHGAAMFCGAINWDHFLRVDDEGNEKTVTYKENTKEKDGHIEPQEGAHTNTKPTRKEIVAMLDTMISSYESLPQNAMLTAVTHSDLLSVLLLVSSLFKSID